MHRTIIITGASGHLGSAVTSHFLSENWHVVCVDRPGSGQSGERGLTAYTCDLTDEKATQETFSTIFEKHPDVTAAAFLAGGFSVGEISSTSTDDIDRMIGLNFKTAYNATRPALGHFRDHQGGDLIFVGAKPAVELDAAPGMLAYALSKSMVIDLAQIINAMDAVPAVRASVIAPSVINTPANREAMPDADHGAWVKPESIAGTIDWLLTGDGRNLRQTVYKMYNES